MTPAPLRYEGDPLILAALEFGPPVPEFRFMAGRRFRFDAAWPERRVAYEREGGTHTQGRHVRPIGYRNDCEKYSEAAILGWCVVRATADMERDGTALALLRRALEGKGR